MPPKRPVHAISPSGSPSPAETTPANTEGSVFSQDGDDLLGGMQVATEGLAPSAVAGLPASSRWREDDTCSSASVATAVAAGLPGNLRGRIQGRVREIEDELSRFLSDSSNKVPVSARNFVMSRVFELVAFCGDLRADAASERGAALALQGQLVETRRETAALQRRVHEAESGLLGAVAADPTRCTAEVSLLCNHSLSF
ncbi:hypothetical protein HPB50_019256 [Hyalomma asiaticum]|uniref:Uncharacterized protein n=1 Tax=Hyalomma asiaticum TaxID=266040 RepID=A0ACB7T3L0_HYAAI|nr:hypothetical protein HPB50_019256 [Hyalomma asiaticum]